MRLHISPSWPLQAGSHVVRRILPNGSIATAAGIGGAAGSTGDGGPATNAKLNGPHSVTSDGAGGFWIVRQAGRLNVLEGQA